MLKPDRPQGRIWVNGTAEQYAQFAIRLGAQVEAGDRSAGNLKAPIAERLADRKRQDGSTQRPTEDVPQGGGTDQRQKDIGTRTNAIIGQRIAKTVVAVRKFEFLRLGDIEKAADAQSGIEREPRQRLGRLAELELEQIVQEYDRLGQVTEKVA